MNIEYSNDEKYYENITKLKHKYKGDQDIYMNDKTIQQHEYENMKLKYCDTIELKSYNKPIKYGRRYSYLIPFDRNTNSAYVNIRSNFTQNIMRCQLEIGGWRLDDIYGKMFGVLRHIYKIEDENVIPFKIFSNGHYLPAAKYHDIRINIEFKECNDGSNVDIPDNENDFDFTLFVDKFETTN
jgi:hypothetical protein